MDDNFFQRYFLFSLVNVRESKLTLVAVDVVKFKACESLFADVCRFIDLLEFTTATSFT